MNIRIPEIEGSGHIVSEIEITLGNGNTLVITETSDNTIEVRNTTHIPYYGDDNLGLFVVPVDHSTIEIIPEG